MIGGRQFFPGPPFYMRQKIPVPCWPMPKKLAPPLGPQKNCLRIPFLKNFAPPLAPWKKICPTPQTTQKNFGLQQANGSLPVKNDSSLKLRRHNIPDWLMKAQKFMWMSLPVNKLLPQNIKGAIMLKHIPKFKVKRPLIGFQSLSEENFDI